MTAQQPRGATNPPTPVCADAGSRESDLTAISAAIENGSVIVCTTRCYGCMFDQHHKPPKWHSWADSEDVAHAEATGQPDPRKSRCGCVCAQEPL
jgi:hypothetical protein